MNSRLFCARHDLVAAKNMYNHGVARRVGIAGRNEFIGLKIELYLVNNSDMLVA